MVGVGERIYGTDNIVAKLLFCGITYNYCASSFKDARLCLHDELDVILTLQGDGSSKMCDWILHGTPFRMTFL